MPPCMNYCTHMAHVGVKPQKVVEDTFLCIRKSLKVWHRWKARKTRAYTYHLSSFIDLIVSCGPVVAASVLSLHLHKRNHVRW